MSENVSRNRGALTRKQQAALLALLANSTVRDAAGMAGMSEKTLWRWLQLPSFVAALRAAQREALDTAICELQGASAKAVQKLVANLDSASDFASNAAALGILSYSLKFREQNEVLSRIEEIEKLLARMEKERDDARPGKPATQGYRFGR